MWKSNSKLFSFPTNYAVDIFAHRAFTAVRSGTEWHPPPSLWFGAEQATRVTKQGYAPALYTLYI